jgi:sec-independent protein translocase protein TatC
MTLLDHLEELRRRIVYALMAVVAGIAAAWSFRESIYGFLARPIEPFLPEGKKLAFLGITDPFVIYFKMCALVGIFAASPFLLYQVYAFVAPGLYRRERRWAFPFVAQRHPVLRRRRGLRLHGGVPLRDRVPALGMGEPFEAVITVQRYFGFLMTVILGLGLMFELPIVIFLLAAMGVVTPRLPPAPLPVGGAADLRGRGAHHAHSRRGEPAASSPCRRSPSTCWGLLAPGW